MAKSKSKKKGGKKTAKRTGQNRTPKLECPYRADTTKPHTTESTGKLAKRFVEDFTPAYEKWTQDVRKAYAAGNDLPAFPTTKFVNPNTGQMSRTACEALMDDETAIGPPVYNPVLVDILLAQNCGSVRRGSTKLHPKPPKDWDEKAYGPWWDEWEDEEGNAIQEPSGWFFDDAPPRRCHAIRAEKLIDEPEKNILTFGNHRYVVGTGTHDGAACFKAWQTDYGNYRSGDSARKRMSLAGNKDIRDVVFRIEDRPNNGGGVTVKGLWKNTREIVFLPGQVLTAGFLHDAKGKRLDAKSIRALDADTKGLKFKPLSEPIVGKAIAWDRLWAEIQKDRAAIKAMRERGGRSEEYEAGDTQTKSITNILVHGKRVDPGERTPFGLRGAQIDQVAFIEATGEGRIEDGCFAMGVVIGARANNPYNVGVHDARGDEEAEVEVEAEAAKPKAKAKSKAKASKPKSSKSKAKKAEKPSDAAPPVEADTADEEETVEAEAVEA